MSFSATVKRELARTKIKGTDAKRAQLAGLTHTAGVLRIGRVLGVEYSMETQEVGQHIADLAQELYGITGELSLRKAEHRSKPLTGLILSGVSVETMLTETGLFRRSEEGVELLQDIPAIVYGSLTCKKAFLRGAFLGSGSLVNPRGGYHLEFVCHNEALAMALSDLLLEFQHQPKQIRRKETMVVYLKEGDSIAGLLALLGAPMAMLQFEDVRAERELRNYINRTSNCETANIGKTVNAAQEQLDAIKKIQMKGGLSRLSPVLRETAELRLNNPELSLQELADLANIKKSGMNNRLQRLIKLAQEQI